MLTSVLKHVYVERKKRWWKDRGKKKTRRTNPLPNSASLTISPRPSTANKTSFPIEPSSLC